MKTSESMKTAIKTYEGLKLQRYKAVATEKYYTIGYGHYGSDVTMQNITIEQANKFFEEDIAKFEKQVSEVLTRYGYTEILENQDMFSALVSFTFNLGKGNLEKLTDYGKRRIQEIHDKIPAYCHAGVVKLKGLENRRKYEQTVFACGMLGIGEENHDSENVSRETFYLDYWVKTNYCLRRKPDYGANTIRVTKKNEKVEVLGMVDAEWVHIKVIETKEECYLHKTGLYIEIMKG